MSGQLRFAIKKPLYFAAVFSASLAVTVLLFAGGIIHYWDTILYDQCINHRVLSGGSPRNPLVVTVDLNDESIEQLGETLDTRRAFADILEVFAESGAASVFDFLFQHEKQHDPSFVENVQWAGDVVIAALAVEKQMVNQPYRPLTETERSSLAAHVWNIKVLEKGKVPQAGSFLLSFPALAETAAQIGHINMEPDSDGIYRRTPLLYEWEGGYIPSLALAAAVVRLGIPASAIELKAGSYLALPLSPEDVIRIPIDEQGYMRIPYTAAWKNDTGRIPFHRVTAALDDDADFAEMVNYFRGRICLVAEISTSQKDFGPASFERLYPLSGIHVEVLSGILDGFAKKAFIGSSSLLFKILTLLLLACIACVGMSAKRDTLYHGAFLCAFAGYSCITLLRWQQSAIAPWCAFPVTFLFLLWLSEFLVRLFVRYHEQALFRSALSRYFPHALAERITREGKTELVPAYKELTILFSDISGFTKWSSDKSPEQVHGFLSDYLESMADILFAHGGTVDKFMGDGILSFFGDPFEMPNHCEQCVQAAIAMQEKARQLAEKWKPIAGIDLKVRIGINIGKVIVGNLGNKTRIEYTVIGAAVNLAQRMESSAPEGGILVTAAVRERVGDKFAFPERKDVAVKGYAQPVEAYLVH